MSQKFPHGDFVEDLYELMKEHGLSPEYVSEADDGTLLVQIPASAMQDEVRYVVDPRDRRRARLQLLLFALFLVNSTWVQF